jgi:RNA 3'-terminal phosphate cyclase (ATP)
LSAVANLPHEIAERQRNRALRRLHALVPKLEPELTLEELPAAGWGLRGTLLLLLAQCNDGQACCFALGARGKRAERVADEAVEALAAFLRSDGSVDPWLADQPLVPLALAEGPFALRTNEVTAPARRTTRRYVMTPNPSERTRAERVRSLSACVLGSPSRHRGSQPGHYF